ncbi:MAG: gamma-glutamyltransferase [Bdellovibrionota bacterium]
MHKILAIIFVSLVNFGCQTSNKVILATNNREDKSTVESTGKKFAISTQGRYASIAAKDIFTQGGNIIDAAVAASFVISVERPQSTGIGGGGFMVFRQKDGKSFAIDFRERAPLKATRNMYIRNGKGDTQISQEGILASATPGLVAGLIEIHKKFGSLPLKAVMQPSIDLAEKGFPVYPYLSEALQDTMEVLKKDAEAKKIFLDANGNPWPLGHILVQKDLAQTLRLISENGSKEFYQGSTAKKITSFFAKEKGLITQKDLSAYKVKWRKPVQGKFHDYDVISMPPPSSGGIHVIQFLSFLEKDELKKKGILSTESIHLAASSLQSAFADRAKYPGDPDFVKVPTEELISPKYNEQRRKEVTLDKARKADQVNFGVPSYNESTETTHLSIMDEEGNAVSTTQTINGWFGSAQVVPGTGIVMNNEMDDFSIQPGVANLFGAIGGTSNAIAPKKTPLSSMSPTIIVKDGKAVMSLGAPGGTRIISCVAQTILNYVEYGLSLKDSVSMIRYHHQWKPDVLTIDPPGPSSKVLADLQKMGYDIKLEHVPCHVMAVSKEDGILRAVADPRDIGVGLAQ